MQISKYAAAVTGVLALAMAASFTGSEERADGYRTGNPLRRKTIILSCGVA